MMPILRFVTIAAVVTLLAACSPSTRFPADVTPLELSLKDECVAVLLERLPAGTKVADISIDRAKGGHVIAVNAHGNGLPNGMCLTDNDRLYYVMTMTTEATSWTRNRVTDKWEATL